MRRSPTISAGRGSRAEAIRPEIPSLLDYVERGRRPPRSPYTMVYHVHFEYMKVLAQKAWDFVHNLVFRALVIEAIAELVGGRPMLNWRKIYCN